MLDRGLTLLLAHELAAAIDGRAAVLRIHGIDVLAQTQIAAQLRRRAGPLLGRGGKGADVTLLVGLQPGRRHDRREAAFGQWRRSLHAQVIGWGRDRERGKAFHENERSSSSISMAGTLTVHIDGARLLDGALAGHASAQMSRTQLAAA